MGDRTECASTASGGRPGPADGPRGPRRVLPAVPGGPLRVRLSADDGVPIEAAYVPCTDTSATAADGLRTGAIVLAHGFTGALDRPAVRRAAQVFAQHAPVVTFSFRGHGRSGGRSTLGDREVLDLAAAVRWARSLGHAHITTVGFSMGGSVVVRHGALYRPDGVYTYEGRPSGAYEGRAEARAGGAAPGPSVARDAPYGPDVRPRGPGSGHAPHTDAIVAISSPARWYYRGTAPMRRVHWTALHPVGRLLARYGMRTRIHPHDWDPVPLSPVAAAPSLAPTPLLVVHGDQDPYFPMDHPLSLVAAADPACTELWTEHGFGHAENAARAPLLHRIASWADARCRESAAARHDGTRETDS